MTSPDWRIIGEREPYYGVLSAPEFRKESIDGKQIEAFYASGRSDIARILQWCRVDLGAAPEKGRALDIGCGVGRLALAMAAHAERVVGYDPAASMLDLARKRAASEGSSNAVFVDRLPVGPFDWLNSYIVFQHIPPKEGLALLEKVLAKAAPGAFLTLQVTVWREAHLAAPANPVSIAASFFGRALARLRAAPPERLIRMYDYNLSEVMRRVIGAGFERAALRHTDHGGHHGVWVIARREG